MSDHDDLTRHNIYLSDSVWQALRQRAIVEHSSANRIIAYLLEQFLENPARIPANRYKARIAMTAFDAAKGRTVRIPAELSERVLLVLQEKTSLANLIETLLREYLVFDLNGEDPSTRESRPGYSTHVVKVGKTEFDLGNNPFTLNV